jgi:hypothetical protein
MVIFASCIGEVFMCNIYIYYSVKSYNNEEPDITLKGDIIKATGHNFVIRDNEGYEHVISMNNVTSIVYDGDYTGSYYTLKPVYVYYSQKAYDSSSPEIEFNGLVKSVNEHNIMVSGEQGLTHIISTIPVIAFVHEGGTHYEIR